MEVGNSIMEHPAVEEANVYGVKVPGWWVEFDRTRRYFDRTPLLTRLVSII
jgi:hypothetical protein